MEDSVLEIRGKGLGECFPFLLGPLMLNLLDAGIDMPPALRYVFAWPKISVKTPNLQE